MNENTKKYDPGLAHLRKALRTLVDKTGATEIRVFDGVETTKHPVTEDGIIAAASWAPEIDGSVDYFVEEAALRVIYDGPYHEGNASEIINDCNLAASNYVRGMTL